jgi:membrane-associated phospholipid phosphatase
LHLVLHSPSPTFTLRFWDFNVNAKIRFMLSALFVVSCLVHTAQSQDDKDQMASPAPSPSAVKANKAAARAVSAQGLFAAESRTGFSGHLADLFQDQKTIVTSPARVRLSDATWLVPLAGITAGFFATDRQFSASLSQNPTTLHHYRTFSNAGVASLIGAGAGLYLFSYPMHNEHWRETGFLAGEAALNSLITAEALKYSFQRERPYQGAGKGQFFSSGTSFPSEHAAAAWSIAGVISHEYPGKLPGLFAYGLASAVSFSRVRARQHFPSDVLVGSALGYLISQSVYRRRHEPEIGGGAWESPHEFVSEPEMRSPSHMGSPYVPLDSWIYPAIERLAALGYVKTDSLGIRPWTRLECVRLLNEAADFAPDVDAAPEVQELIDALSQEFAADSDRMNGERNVHAQLESVYQRSLVISGRPLTDGYHFGQTVLNDYGRPFQQGFNTVAGTSAWAVAGPFVFYARGEYQYAPSAPAPSAAVLNFISTEDYLPPNAPSTPVAQVNRFRALEAYVGVNIANWQMSFGRQSLWWGASEGGTMAFTNNAAPLNIFRLNRVSPFRLPSIFSYLGDLRLDFFLGQVSGQEFINNGKLGATPTGQYGHSLSPQPFLSGGRISFKFTENFEFNMSKTTLYGGPGNPLNFKTLLKSAFGVHVNGEALGDGRSTVDFAYRIPKMRNWLTLYGEGFTEDEISPLNKASKSVWQGGLYLAKVPKIAKLDMRVEGGSTSPVNFSTCNGCFYHNFQYVNGFTNNGQLMGTWIGRAAQGEAIWSNYWFSATKKIGIELRHRQVDRQFLPQGGTQNDVAVNPDFLLKSGFRFSGTLQYERWQIPLLATNRQSNVTASIQFSYWPRVRTK